jgi:DNA-directed RNA polymerase specialized sigma subunit
MYDNPEILWPKTKHNVLVALKVYNYYFLSLINESGLKISEDYRIEVNVNQFRFSNKTKKEENKRIEIIKQVITSFNKLNNIDKEIIYRTYLSKIKVNDDVIANDLGFSVKYYYKIKKRSHN